MLYFCNICREVFKEFCKAAKLQLSNPVSTAAKDLPKIHQSRNGNNQSVIKGLTNELVYDIIQNHENSSRSWEKQIEKVIVCCF